jgi:hypothetical protein
MRPPDDFVKINSDGVIDGHKGMAASGVVAREGYSFCGARGKTYIGIEDPIFIEAVALRDVVRYASERNFQKVVFEVDCEPLLSYWK